MLTTETYHADNTRISNSAISALLQSPAHYYARFLAPDRQPFDTNAFKLGRALHVALSEPETFFDRYIIAPGGIDRRTREGKEKYEQFLIASRGRVVLPEQPTCSDGKASKTLCYDQIMRMRDAVMAHPIAMQLMLSGKAETVHTWEDAISGTLCKGMFDWLPDGGNFIVDFKSTADASPAGFARSCVKYGYDRQAAFYLDGMYHETGKNYTFIFITVESVAPYAVELYALSDTSLINAREKINTALMMYNKCKSSGVWHTYNEFSKIKILDL